MKIKKITLIFTIAFTFVMITLTFTARAINNNFFLTNVKVNRLTNERFEIYTILDDGTEITPGKSALAIPKEFFDSQNEFYIIESRIKNGENRTFAKRIYITTGGENDTSYLVESGVNRSDFLIFENNKPLQDGDEAYVVK